MRIQPAPQILHQGSLPTLSAHLLEAISLLRTFKKYPDNMKNLPEEGGLPSPTKATKGQSPGTHRSAIRGTNPRSQAYFPDRLSNFTPSTQNGPRAQIRAVKDHAIGL